MIKAYHSFRKCIMKNYNKVQIQVQLEHGHKDRNSIGDQKSLSGI